MLLDTHSDTERHPGSAARQGYRPYLLVPCKLPLLLPGRKGVTDKEEVREKKRGKKEEGRGKRRK